MTKKKKKIKWLEISGLVVSILGVIAAWLVVPELRDFFAPIEVEHVSPIEYKASTNENNEISISDLFPYFIGTKREYRFGTLSDNRINQMKTTATLGKYTETVVSVKTGISNRARVVEVQVEGENFFTDCNKGELFSGEISIWYIMNDKQLFIACSKEEVNAIANDLVRKGVTEIKFPSYIAPLNIGDKWPVFTENDLNREDNAYVWFVESIVPVTVPYGSFENCYRIVLFTNPDTTVRYVCPGIGLVASHYTHHGTVRDFTSELANHNIP
jgi:hypothetical protein